MVTPQPDIGNSPTYWYGEDPFEVIYQLLINKTENPRLIYLNYSKAIIEYSNNIDDIYKNIEGYNLNKRRQLLIVSYDIISVILNNKKLNSIVT